jgi:hypothetical protein
LPAAAAVAAAVSNLCTYRTVIVGMNLLCAKTSTKKRLEPILAEK